MKTIYKKDSKGKIRYLTISTQGHLLVQESGIVGTANAVVNKSVCEPKNVGRSNATTADEQAISEAASKLTEKLKTGYFNTVAEAEAEGGKDFLLPMLAKDYNKEKAKVRFPCWVQPKLDGMRCLKQGAKLKSRKNEPILTMEHVAKELLHIADVFDGELYTHGQNFQENMRLIKKYRKGESETVKYYVYDMVLDKPFEDRYLILSTIVKNNDCPSIELVPTFKIDNEEQLLAYHKKFINEGYEGTIVRHGDTGYDINKRSSSLLKYKDFIDEAYKVIDVVPSESRPEQGVIVCTTTVGLNISHKENVTTGEIKGGVFSCGMKFSHAERKEILKNKQKYIGKMAEVRFFEFSEDGIPRFPVCVGFRLDK